MARAIWKGRIQFGPVDIPVKLYSAVQDIDVHSHLLHDQDNFRLEQRMVCSQEDKLVPDDQIVKGYEVTENEYVLVEPDELNFLQPAESRNINVMEFVPQDQLDFRLLDRPYYLGPDNDDQMYINFLHSLKNSKLAGICQWTMRKKAYLGSLRFQNDILTLTTQRYFSEIVPEDSFNLEDVKLSSKEIGIAKSLISELQEKFQPDKYHEEYQAKLQALVEQKAKGKKIELPALEKIKETKDDKLLSTLEQSLKSIKKK
jgi:DNA end-binding protein Ku